jgi:transcriptional regulator with PAS, ATPase and Fis domain
VEATSRDFSNISAISAGMGSRNHQQHVRLIGKSPQIHALQIEIDRVARSDAKVLITGESGVGKEIVSRSIHYGSPRANMTFAPVNCAGLPETLLESELFGHVKGSFTGAYRDKPGKLESAHMGTVFLDEIGEMTLRMQGLLLRFLETGEIQRVGADGGARHVNVREDIPELVTHFLNKFVVANRSPIAGVSPDAMKALVAYSWPGNVRELENLIERMVVAVQHELIDLQDLPSEVRSQDNVAFRPRRERRRTVADDLYLRLTEQHESFWATVYPMYMAREITRQHVRDVVRRGLEEARGNYKIVARLFNMESREYKRFLNFLRKHDCQLPFKEYR